MPLCLDRSNFILIANESDSNPRMAGDFQTLQLNANEIQAHESPLWDNAIVVDDSSRWLMLVNLKYMIKMHFIIHKWIHNTHSIEESLIEWTAVNFYPMNEWIMFDYHIYWF